MSVETINAEQRAHIQYSNIERALSKKTTVIVATQFPETDSGSEVEDRVVSEPFAVPTWRTKSLQELCNGGSERVIQRKGGAKEWCKLNLPEY